MSDNDELDLDGGDAAGLDGSPKKTSGRLGSLLPNILKFAAIGLAAVIFIVTVAIITVRVVSGGGKAQTAMDPASPYVGKRPIYSDFTLIGPITTRTRDTAVYSVTVDMIIQYDENDSAAQTELVRRQNELRHFVRNYFSSKYAAELQPEEEIKLRKEIREILNTRFLDTAKARDILFTKFDVMEAF
jgi:flagellar FliL protein